MSERSLNAQHVIEEDEYMEGLSQIIARDFFPSLSHLNATNNYLDAVHSRDPHLINASVRKLEEINATPSTSKRPRPYQTPSQTPYFQGGPSDTPIPDQPQTKRPRYDNLSLDQFQSVYTSEDNSSFVQILDDENKARKDRWSWAWDAQRRADAQNVKAIQDRERSLIEAPSLPGVREKFVIEAPVPVGLIKASEESPEDNEEEEGKDTEAQVALRQESPSQDVLARKKDTRKAGVDGWKFKARNSLMFSPDADVVPYQTSLIANQGKGDPKSIRHTGTRLPDTEHSSSSTQGLSEPPSPTRSHIDAAIAGVPYHSQASGLGLVPNLPSPTPSELGPAAVKQLLTWGTLNATPRLISQSEGMPSAAPSTPFHLPDISSREALSHRLSNNASKSLRVRAGLFGAAATRTPAITPRTTMGPPSWTPRKSEAARGNLTPAAKRLLNRSTMGTAAAKRAEAITRAAGWDGKAAETDLNRVRWTPSPAPRR